MAAFTERGEHYATFGPSIVACRIQPGGLRRVQRDHFLTDPTHRGDTQYPASDRLDDRHWALGPDDFEKVTEEERQDLRRTLIRYASRLHATKTEALVADSACVRVRT